MRPLASSVGTGLSPRVRGSRVRRGEQGPCAGSIRGEQGPCAGSIPACAGEPVRDGVPMRISQVYPRVCGGAL